MPRIAPLQRDAADPKTAGTLDAVKAKIGMVPNLFSTFARAPAVLEAYLGFDRALSNGRLNARQREVIALAVGQANSCQYCLSAHTALAKGTGLSEADIRDARAGKGEDRLNGAIAALAVQIIERRGNITDEEFGAAAAAGIDQPLMIEIVANVCVNVLTNYTNNLARTRIDFPAVSL
jgi:uncharacterized peroxidase-related enzyme